jgi:hypothetical protein|tara:strand:+ start:1588 stop:1842 length:255 start_codon:yes stop_codon:yes gene_type:complete
MTTSNDQLYRAIGTLEGTVKEGFKAVHHKIDGIDERQDRAFSRINELENSGNKIKGGLKTLVVAVPFVSGAVGAVAAWLSKNGM